MTRTRLLLLLGKLLFSGALLWLVLLRVDVSGIFVRLRATDLHWLLPAVLLSINAVFLVAWRWRLLSLGLLSYGQAMRYTWIGVFFSSIVPGVIGGDVAKGISLAAKATGARDSRLPISIAMDKLVGLWVLLLGFSGVALATPSVQPRLLAGLGAALWLSLAATLGGLIAAIVLCHPAGAARCERLAGQLPGAWLRRAAGWLTSALGGYRGRGGVLVRAALISLLNHALTCLWFWFAMRALFIPASLWFAAVFYSLLSGLLALPISFSGVGVRDVFAAGMFAAFGLNPESGVALSWLLLGMTIPNVTIGGLLQLWEIFHRPARPA